MFFYDPQVWLSLLKSHTENCAWEKFGPDMFSETTPIFLSHLTQCNCTSRTIQISLISAYKGHSLTDSAFASRERAWRRSIARDALTVTWRHRRNKEAQWMMVTLPIYLQIVCFITPHCLRCILIKGTLRSLLSEIIA